MPATTTGSSRPASSRATTSSTAGWRRRAAPIATAASGSTTFSLEFLIGRLLFDALGNLGITDTARAALRGLEVDLDRLRALEPDAALGNGGLGRLAACFMESMATLGDPGPRLRHPLRPRHLPPGAAGRLAARIARGLALLRQSVGVRASGGRVHDRLRRHRREPRAARTAPPSIAGSRRKP